MQRSDSFWLIGVILAAVAFSVWGLPYFSQLGHPLLSLLVYGFFVVIFLYGRNNRLPASRDRSRAKVLKK
jgi:hypothetical protein